MEEIKTYLESENPDFETGFSLFCKYSRNQSLMAWIGRKKDRGMLLYNLRKMLKQGTVKINPVYSANMARFSGKAPGESSPADPAGPEQAEKKVESIFAYAHRYKREELPETLLPLYDKNTDAYKELRALHEKMKQCNSEPGRAAFRKDVLTLAGEIEGRWALITKKADEFHAAGGSEDQTISLSRLNTARAYISRMLKKESITEEQRLKVQEYYSFLIEHQATIKEETIAKLKERGFIS